MSPSRRAALCGEILTLGYSAQAALEKMTEIERPPLRAPLTTIPMVLGDWVGRDERVEPTIVARSQATSYLNRSYESNGRRFCLWINYSDQGLNLRHSPEVCLPAGGWTKIESQCKVLDVEWGAGKSIPVTRLGYAQGELVQSVGFWYYIFGEGWVERSVRRLPITSKSSHGRATRGSAMTVEVFCPGAADPDGDALTDFAHALLVALEPLLPEERAEYHVP